MTLFQVLVLSIVLFPLVVLYYLGLYICAAIAGWRLVERDYHGGTEDGNLKVALDVLYSLAVAQGAIFLYRITYYFAGRGAAEKVIKEYKMNHEMVNDEAVRRYLRETRSRSSTPGPGQPRRSSTRQRERGAVRCSLGVIKKWLC